MTAGSHCAANYAHHDTPKHCAPIHLLFINISEQSESEMTDSTYSCRIRSSLRRLLESSHQSVTRRLFTGNDLFP